MRGHWLWQGEKRYADERRYWLYYKRCKVANEDVPCEGGVAEWSHMHAHSKGLIDEGKGEDPLKPECYRGITLSSVSSKLL